jgi:D-mannonate dehydratase
MPFEKNSVAGYDALGRLFAIGYLKGIIDSCERYSK